MDEKKQLTSQEVHQAGGLLAMHGAASNNLNELQRMILGVRKGKAYIHQRQQEKTRTMDMLQQEIRVLEGKYHTLHDEKTNYDGEYDTMQAVEDLLVNEVQAKQNHYKSLGILPAESMDEDAWMAAVDPKYLTTSPSNQLPSDKEENNNNIMHGNEAIALKAEDDGKADSLAPLLHDEKKAALAPPPASTKTTNTKKKAKK